MDSFMRLLKMNFIFNDMAEPWQLGFQDSAAPGFTGMTTLHDEMGFFLIIISFSVFWVLFSMLYYYNHSSNSMAYKYLKHSSVIEIIWTMTPAMILVAIAFPSFSLLYIMDEVLSPTLTIKMMGHQWYWSYEYSDFVSDTGESMDFDSYMMPESDLEIGQFSLLDVDNKLVMPTDCHISLMVSGSDVIHSFAVPSLGLKIDCVPGSLNQVSFISESEATFYGQCSEICGVWHGFMPMVVKSVSTNEFLLWLESQS